MLPMLANPRQKCYMNSTLPEVQQAILLSIPPCISSDVPQSKRSLSGSLACSNLLLLRISPQLPVTRSTCFR